MPETVQVSVVVATYNRGVLLRENLDAVLAQDCGDYEAIYVDDGSTDDTPAILAEVAAAHPGRLRTLRVTNRSQGPARNAGVDVARGQLILFTDDDTVPPPDWVSSMAALWQRHGCDALSGGFAAYSRDTPAERYLYYREHYRFGDRAKRVRAAPMMSFLISRATFLATGGFIPGVSEDWALCHSLRSQDKTIMYDPSVKVRHHYQRDRAAMVSRVKAPAILGLYQRIDRGQWGAPYVAYTAWRFLSSPLWCLWRFPLRLYPLAVSMEGLFFFSRLDAYLREILGGKRRPVS